MAYHYHKFPNSFFVLSSIISRIIYNKKKTLLREIQQQSLCVSRSKEKNPLFSLASPAKFLDLVTC